MSKILVTGGAGFVGGHCVLQLLALGHEVRATVRTLAREKIVHDLVASGGGSTARLTVVGADLVRDDGWSEAVRGCELVLHVASPFPPPSPTDESDLIAPARDGTLRVLRASRDAGVQRVVVTSSFGAIGYGHTPQEAPFTERYWTDPDAADVQPYVRSKVLAERAAWDFISREGGGLELTVINPVGIFGPLLGREVCSSIAIVQRMLDGGVPACPRVYFGAVDVRDVVDLHVRAMSAPEARGERFLAVAGDCMSMLDVAKVLHSRLGDAAKRAPTTELDDEHVRRMAETHPALRAVVPQLGLIRRASSEKAQRLLGWSPRSNEEAIAATGESLVRMGLVGGAAATTVGL